MQSGEIVTYVNNSLGKSGLKLSEAGEKAILERYKKSEKDGGFSEHWRNISLEDAESNRSGVINV